MGRGERRGERERVRECVGVKRSQEREEQPSAWLANTRFPFKYASNTYVRTLQLHQQRQLRQMQHEVRLHHQLLHHLQWLGGHHPLQGVPHHAMAHGHGWQVHHERAREQLACPAIQMEVGSAYARRAWIREKNC